MNGLAVVFLIIAITLAFCCWVLTEAVNDERERTRYWQQQCKEIQENAFVWYDAWQEAVWGAQQRIPELYDADRRPTWRRR